WQRDRSLYRVWVSEIMLQQTQVATVVPYYERFVARFPNVAALAAAPLDEVLHYWTGLGYYARARNLQRAARLIVARHGGEVPAAIDALEALPGIGRSTAGAILALALGRRHPILDGNVKRVLARWRMIGGAAQRAAVAAQLWALAEELTPSKRIAEYTQAIMDLGATVCTRRQPHCERCPVAADCAARLAGRVGEFPASRRVRRGDRVRRRTVMLLAMNERREVLLERRAEQGIWGGLWCFPEFANAAEARAHARRRLLQARWPAAPLPPVEHAFTHFDLTIEPWLARCAGERPGVADDSAPRRQRGAARPAPRRRLWYNPAQPRQRLGLPQPVKTLLEQLTNEDAFGGG
ncbi:MAG: A/G-specific adenine glycosylase, partial [Steroidobacteraceae bacterium]|nr:A/G-specific adenine glycosylase [Steroidobacteraceae bacterium]